MSVMDEPDLSPSFVKPKPLLCFRVEGNDDPEDTKIIFATSSIAAKREWSSEHWDGKEIAGISASRQPQWDEFAPGPVPALELIDAGWWFECHGCMTRIATDYIGTTERVEDEYDPLDREYGPDLTLPIMKPVELKHQRVFCTQACCDKYQIEKRRIKTMKRRAIKVLQDAIVRKYPGVTFKDEGHWSPHIYINRSHGYLIIHQTVISFVCPGMKYGATHRTDDEKWRYARVRDEAWDYRYGGYKMKSLPMSERKRNVTLGVANGDKEVWDEWTGAAKPKETAEAQS